MDMPTSLEMRCRSLLDELGLLPSDASLSAAPLSGGVASDIARVAVGDQLYCVKFALPKLRVAADWFAPVERNFAEYSWLQTVASIAPENAVHLYGHSGQAHGFVMEFLAGKDTYLLKTEMLAGRGQESEAAAIGGLLGRIHAASTVPGFDASPFANQTDFHAIRIEPYLVHTATKHTDLAPMIHDMADALFTADNVLIHGDVSPKNIMFRGTHPFMLDAECATMGDACFDLAFCLNHFILKAVHVPARRADYLTFCSTLWRAYAPQITWEDAAGLEARMCRLLPMLMLARVDGKSPVEYLNDANRDLVVSISSPLIRNPVPALSQLVEIIAQDLGSS